jgi:outer membrane biosynthesis protein TonB
MGPGQGQRRDEFRRMLWVSVGLHAALLVVFMVSPAPSAIAPPQAISVELVAAAPQASPAPAPAPAPRPKPAEVVLPERPREPAKPAPKPKPKPKPKPRREVVLPPKPRVERDLDDLLAEMREEAGEPSPKPVVEAAVAPEPTRGAVQMSPEEAAWQAKVKAHIRRTWVVPFDFRDRSLVTQVELPLDASGRLRGQPRLVRGSGNLAYDDGVLDGIRRADPFPAPPEAGNWPFIFNSEDY